MASLGHNELKFLIIFSVRVVQGRSEWKLFWFFREEGSTDQFITQSGFQFLLMDTPSQVWYFMLQYLDTVEVS